MKVLFVVPRSHNPKQMYREYPLGVGFIGTVLEQHGHRVSVYDQNVEGLEESRLWDRLDQVEPDVVGFSVITPNYPVARRQIARARETHPDIWTVAGGIHANLFPEDLLADGVDFVLLGEGEHSMPALLRELEAGSSPEGVDGVVFRDGRGGVVKTPKRAKGVDLEQLPIVNRELYNLPLYTHHSMLASRGCPYHCTFCCNYTGTILSRGVTLRPYQRVVDEMRHLQDRYRTRQIFFADDIFLLKRSSILAFCKAVEAEGLHVTWIGQLRVDSIDDEVADAMVRANCERCYFGVESGSDAILQRVGKGITRETIRRGIRAAKASGMRVKTGWIFGLPGSLEEQYESIAFMRDIRPHEISIHQLIPFPGTEYYRRAADYGIRIRDPKNFESFCYGGLDDNISFDYLSQADYVRLLEATARALEADGYVSSDRATPKDRYVYTTPLCSQSMNVFRPAH
jgi:radical SAM superfamily enzyme YgiQ (UPF0313 family)